MSQIYEENKRQRTVKLCQLIYDRQIDSAIGFEIRKLLEEGLLIDYRDQNRNQKTALHLAVEKCDVTCVKFLLRFKPRLEVTDGDGKTPAELAESKGFQNILNALLNSTFDVINESYVEVIDYESLTQQKVEAIKLRPTFKVLKLTNCPSLKKILKKITHRAYITTFNETSHLFLIFIETKETRIQNGHEFELMKKVLNLRRPMIVQLTSADSRKSKIYFKDEKMRDFVKISDTTKINQEKFDEAVQSDEDCNMKLLVAALRSNLFGSFTGDLLHTKLNANEDRNEAVKQFAISNALCHRFFKLFDESSPQNDRIISALSFEGDQSLLALLDLPFKLKDEKLKLTEYQQDTLRVVDSSGCNLLTMAADQGNLDAVKLLLRCGCDFNHSDNYHNHASDICWEMKDFGCLAELIEAGSPFPSNFRVEELNESPEAKERINAIIEKINLFHANIKQGKTEEVKKFIASHSNIKHAFDIDNKCALTVALQSNQVDIYSLLLSEGFEPGADDEYKNACSESKFKNQIRDSHRKYFKEAFDEPHLKRLLKMFRLSLGSKDRAKCSKIIRRMFDDLNEIDELIPILKICSLCDKLQIVFDFNCNSIVDMDPTSPSNALGVVYPIGGFIYIGAKNHEKEFCKVIGTLIHELTHYAMKMTYENSCKPYDDGDTANENRFEEITTETKKICDENPSTDSIVRTVFTCYKQIVWHQELIVRVPQLLAHYKMNPQALKAAERNIPELFHFYRENTLKDVERESKVLLQKYLISKINKQTGIARKIENLNVKFENVAIDLKSSVNVIRSNAPRLTLAMLIQNNSNNSHIFVSLEQVATGNILEKIAKANAKEIPTALIVDCIGLTQKYQNSLGKLVRSMKNIKTIALVMTAAEGSKTKKNFPKVEFKTLIHKWDELTESSKVHLLGQNVIFHGIEMKLNELVEPSSEAMNFFPLCEIVDLKDFKIGSELHQTSHKFYIPRKFIKKGQVRSSQVAASAKSFEELSRSEPSMGAMIISDEAGSGKSVALFEIAKSLHIAFPVRWVLLVDLKRHIEAFKNVEDHERIELLEEFIVQNIFNNEPEFDSKLFRQMFRAGKTFVLLDGFEEVSPNYKNLLLHVLKLFQPASGNQLFITTRPHLEADLKGVLGKFVFEIEELSKEGQRKFLREYWKSVKLEISHDDLEVLSNRLLGKFSKIATSNIVGFPLLMRMMAEIFEDPIKENLLHKVESLNIAFVFDHFVDKYFLRWREKGSENEIPREEGSKIERDGGVLAVHHKIAVNYKFEEKFMSFEVDESDAEKISRVGLIRYHRAEKTFQFVHETFAEYFVADFIWFHLNTKNRNPSHDCSKAVEILIEVLAPYEFGVIRTFLDQILEAMNFIPSVQFCKSVAKYSSEIVKSRNRFDFLSTGVFDSCENLAILFLSIVKHVEKEVLLKILRSKGKHGASVLHNAAKIGSAATVSILCGLITTCTDNTREIFQDGCRLGNVLFRAASNKNAGVLTTVCVNLNSVLTKNEIKTMFKERNHGENIIARAAHNDNDEVFLELISSLPNYLSPDEVKSLFSSVDDFNQNFFHCAVIRNAGESLKVKFDIIKSHFDLEEQKTFLFKPPTATNMFHCATQNQNEKIFETIFESTRDVLSVKEMKLMLMVRDSDGSNMLHIIAQRGNKIVLNGLYFLLRRRLTDEKIKSLLLEVNNKGQNCFRLAANNSKLGFQVFCEIIGNLLPIEDQTRLLQQSIHEIDIIQIACGNYDTNEILSSEAIKQLLTKKYPFGRNIFHEVAESKRGNVETWNKLISFAQARFSAGEMKSYLFCDDEERQNCLELAVCKRANMIGAICETIRAVLNVEDQKNFVRQKDFRNRNLFHLAVENRLNKSNLFELYDGLSAILSNDEFKNFLFDVDLEGRNFFYSAIRFSSNFEIKSLSKSIKGILNHDDQKKFFGIKSPNVFHLAVENEESGIFSTLHECLKHVFDADELKTLVTGSDDNGSNVLLLAAQFSFPLILKELISFIQNELSIDDQRNLIQKCDKDGKNIFMFASQNEDPEVCSVVENYAKEILSKNQIKKLKYKNWFENGLRTVTSIVPVVFARFSSLLFPR